METDLQIAVQQDTIDKIVIMEIKDGFFVMVNLKFSGEKNWYLATRRDRTRPRVFKDLNRLNEYLKTNFPTDSVEIIRNQKLPVSKS